tara:strand:+ start:23319 stop:23552 length:234 start_codon:yes stop_codon:yes gene_type:complete
MDDLEIGDALDLTLSENDKWDVLRVHGGWIYTRIYSPKPRIHGADLAEPSHIAPVFVPEPQKPYNFVPQKVKILNGN